MNSEMKNTKSEKTYIKELRQNYELFFVNKTSHNISALIENMSVCDPPDFVFNNHYVEKFEVDSDERFPNRSGKMASLHKSDYANLQKRVNTSQDIFNIVNYTAPREKTNISHLKNNIEELIAEKTKKQKIYEKYCPDACYRHLMIELKSRPLVYLDGKDHYISDVVSTKNLRTENYEVYRDYYFIKQIQKKYIDKWDLLIFVEYVHNKGIPVYNLSCLDLKEDIDPMKMKKYPKRILQIAEEGREIISLRGSISTTNVGYQLEDKATTIYSLSVETILLNNIVMKKHCFMDSVYMSEDEGFFFETSQIRCAINPNATERIIAKYIPIIILDKLILIFNNAAIALNRITPLDCFFHCDGEYGYYRINNDTSFAIRINNMYD